MLLALIAMPIYEPLSMLFRSVLNLWLLIWISAGYTENDYNFNTLIPWIIYGWISMISHLFFWQIVLTTHKFISKERSINSLIDNKNTIGILEILFYISTKGLNSALTIAGENENENVLMYFIKIADEIEFEMIQKFYQKIDCNSLGIALTHIDSHVSV